MGKNKLKKQLKRQQRDVLGSASSADATPDAGNSSSNKKQKTKKSSGENETEVEIDTLDFDDAFSAGLAFEQLESHDGALVAFQRAVKCQPSHLGAITHLADVYSAAGQPDEALKCYMQASELEDGKADASVWFRLGLTHAAMDQQLKATKVYKKSLEINAEALESMKDRDEDTAELKKAYGVTLAALADAFGELGNIDSAVKVFEDAVIKFPENANMHYNLANMRMARNGSSGNDAFDAEVAKGLERAFKLSPDTRDFVEDLAAYLEQHGQQPKFVRELKEKAEKLPSAQDESANAGEDVEEEEASSGSDEEESEEE
ncbi:putative UDP-N-acetylglucosamine--peptide N-acetylglucosaminyltransferase SEC [Phytophthora citrophthora]|uniref:UDP-N-acetylglucosamine--peptide N-acetylglucosaminyltransferase SEC n=1 Tax=Phytophthora citrophthora TaxID=4793 RepID=A0AAD9GR99_9STRA|nr:putative UDP-N-acetylglucosamine--peptide N-acetylglucosaminyltransferase SEC [Phytophthora citrophthora]